MDLSQGDIETIVRRVLDERDMKQRREETGRKYERTRAWGDRLLGGMVGGSFGFICALILLGNAHH